MTSYTFAIIYLVLLTTALALFIVKKATKENVKLFFIVIGITAALVSLGVSIGWALSVIIPRL